MKLIGCFLLIYLAVVARATQGEMLGIVDLLAVSVVVVLRWSTPSTAAILAFVAGLLADGMSTGTLGAHAAANVAVTAVLIRWGFSSKPWSLGRWITAILCLVGSNTLVMALSRSLPLMSGPDWERWAVSQSMTALATAVLIVVFVCCGRLLFGVPCETR